MSENTQAVEQQETLVVETEDGPVRIDHVDLISKNDKIDMTLTVDMTPTTGLLLDAMAKAKAKMKTTSISKDAENTYFTNKQTGKAHSFATLDATLDFFTSAYAEFGVTLTQIPHIRANGSIGLGNLLGHSSGEKIWSVYPLTWSKDKKIQDLGSEITYGRRYTAQPIMGVAPSDDDDGNVASDRGGAHTQSKQDSTRNTLDDKWNQYYLKTMGGTHTPDQADEVMMEFISHSTDTNFLFKDSKGTAERLVKYRGKESTNHTQAGISVVLKGYRDANTRYTNSYQMTTVLKSILEMDCDAVSKANTVLGVFKDKQNVLIEDHAQKISDDLSILFKSAKTPAKTVEAVFPFLSKKKPQNQEA